MISRRRLIKLSAASVFAPTIVGSGALAQTWPSRHLRIVIPFPPGGGADFIARLVANKMSEMLGQQVIVGMQRSGSGYRGTVYNLENGRTYRGRLDILDERRIRLSRCVLAGLICRSEVWTRAE